MKKYDCSVVDFSEIEYVTSDYLKINESSERMKKLGMLKEDGSVDEDRIKRLVSVITVPLFAKLSRRIRNRNGGISGVFLNYSMMVERNEYIGAYFYLAFLYGFLQWRVPEAVSLIPAHDNVLECFIDEFGRTFSSHIEKLLDASETE